MEYPSFWGETLPVISRAVDEEEDEFGSNDIKCNISIQWTPDAKDEMSKAGDGCIGCNMLFIGVGQEASGFLNTYLLYGQTTELLAILSTDEQDHLSESSREHTTTKDRYCFVRCLKSQPSVLFILCTLQVSQYQAPSWTDQLFSCLRLPDAAQVVVLMTDLTCNYHSEQSHNDLPAPFMRSLKTSCYNSEPHAPYLEQPNVISGLPAQIMTYLEIHQVPAVLYTCYKDVSFVDIKTMKLFCKILQSAPLKKYAVENPNADHQLIQLSELHRDKSTLYI